MISRGRNKALLLLFEVPAFPLLLSAWGKQSLSVNCPRSWPHDSLLKPAIAITQQIAHQGDQSCCWALQDLRKQRAGFHHETGMPCISN